MESLFNDELFAGGFTNAICTRTLIPRIILNEAI